MAVTKAELGTPLLKRLTINDSWIRKTYVAVAKAGRELSDVNVDATSLVDYARQFQQDVLARLPIEGISVRQVDYAKVAELTNFIGENRSGLMVMRHGIQFIEDEERKKLSGSVKKIRLMQMPFNDTDPADAQSLAEAASLALVFRHIGRKNNIPVDILTSRNTRAADIGAVISVLNGFRVHIDDRLACVNYPIDKTDGELEELLGKDQFGALQWKREILDSVCGDGTYRTIDANMRGIVGEFGDAHKITLCITHTPQTNAADVIAGDFPVRMPELGFRVFSGNNSLRFADSIFSTAA